MKEEVVLEEDRGTEASRVLGNICQDHDLSPLEALVLTATLMGTFVPLDGFWEVASELIDVWRTRALRHPDACLRAKLTVDFRIEAIACAIAAVRAAKLEGLPVAIISVAGYTGGLRGLTTAEIVAFLQDGYDKGARLRRESLD